MQIIKFEIYHAPMNVPGEMANLLWGSAVLFDTNLMVISNEHEQETKLEARRVEGRETLPTVMSGGQDGMLNYLKKHNLTLSSPIIKSSDQPEPKEVSLLQLALAGQPKQRMVDGNGNLINLSIPWSINNQGLLELTKYIGSIKPKLKPWVIVVDGDVAAFMHISDFKKPHYGVTDTQGGGHNFWIPFMMSGGRSGAGYIMVLLLPDIQSDMMLEALKNETNRNEERRDKVFSYIFEHFPKIPLPEFADRMGWMDKKQEESDFATMFDKLKTLIRRKSPEVFDNNYTLDGGYVVDGQEYDDSELNQILEKRPESRRGLGGREYEGNA